MTSRRPARAARATALLITALAVLCGCRIPGTGVVQVGEAATGVRTEIPVYLVLGGELVPVLRTDEGAPFDVADAVALLYRGPTEEEAQAGLTTELARPSGTGGLPRTVVKGDEISVGIPHGERLGSLALLQIGCTAYAARTYGVPGAEGTTVTFGGRTGTEAPRPGRRTCPAPGQYPRSGMPGAVPAVPSSVPDPVPSYGTIPTSGGR
ncbi:hypothetical protein ACFY7Z_08850 [Streptomyces sp. NPDC012623]|uniref:hypothetical protein n=1 Tax=unclassified Streptomyces TaxID=2593676 RepID=UPI00367FD52C